MNCFFGRFRQRPPSYELKPLQKMSERAEGRKGYHEPDVDPELVKHGQVLARVFVELDLWKAEVRPESATVRLEVTRTAAARPSTSSLRYVYSDWRYKKSATLTRRGRVENRE